VTVFGEKLTVTPGGCPLDVRFTGEEKPLREVINTIADAEWPGDAVTFGGETTIMKSLGDSWEVTCKEKS